MEKRPDSELLQKNGGIIRPTMIFFFFETFSANSSGGFEGPQTLFGKKKSPLSLFIFSVSSLVLLILSSCLLSSPLSSSLFLSRLVLSCLSFSVSL